MLTGPERLEQQLWICYSVACVAKSYYDKIALRGSLDHQFLSGGIADCTPAIPGQIEGDLQQAMRIGLHKG